MDFRQKILTFIRMRGPSLPVHITKEINQNILMSSAILSELVSKGDLKISNVKVGGSPLYYLPGQEGKLLNFVDRLNPKDRKALELLKGQKILRDSRLEPLQRVSLRQIKDFAIPLKVQISNNIELFWKWYLVSGQEAESIVKAMLGNNIPKKDVAKQAEAKLVPQKRTEPRKLGLQSSPDKPLRRILTRPKIRRLEPKKNETPKPEPKPKPIVKKPELKEVVEQEEISEPKQFIDRTGVDEFVKRIHRFFKKNRIDMLEQNIIRKGSEVDFIVTIPSTVGSLTYYCKAKSKKRNNDTDLASALVQGQMKKLPVLYLMAGELTKRAKEMVHKEFKGMTIKQF